MVTVVVVVVVVDEVDVVVDPGGTTNWSCCEVTPLPSGFCEADTEYVPLDVGVNEKVQSPSELLVTDPLFTPLIQM